MTLTLSSSPSPPSVFAPPACIQNILSTPTLLRLAVSTTNPKGPARDGSRMSVLDEGMEERRERKRRDEREERSLTERLVGPVGAEDGAGAEPGGVEAAPGAAVAMAVYVPTRGKLRC